MNVEPNAKRRRRDQRDDQSEDSFVFESNARCQILVMIANRMYPNPNLATTNVEQGRERSLKGRKRQWKEAHIDDMVDIKVNNEQYKKKRIFTDVKRQKNTV